MLFDVESQLQMLCSGRHRRSRAMQQLSFLDPPVPDGAAPAWNALDEEQRAKVISMLVQLIAKMLAEPERDYE